MPRIITYNVNGIRAALNKGLADWMVAAAPDILLIQETKAQPEQIPSLQWEALGYQAYWHSAEKKGYSGVGILTKIQPDKIIAGMNMPVYDREGRFLRADFGDITVVSIYHPSGSSSFERQDFKMQWLEDFYAYIRMLKQERPKLILSGDYNICHQAIDIHDPIRNATSSGFLPEEREWMSRFLEMGFVDSFRAFNPNPHHYTWWSYRANARAKNLGWRIDYHMVSQSLADQMKGAQILPEAKHSDHCPALLDIQF